MPKRAAVLVAFSVLQAPAQTAKPAPTFEVASIKQTDPSNRPAQCFMRGQPGGQTFAGRCIPVSLIIKRAYMIVDAQISGGPDWLNTTLFDFDAKTEKSVTRADVEPMFQAFLAERFHLQMHTETRTMQALVLTVDKSGNKMTPNTSDNEWEIPIQPAPGAIPKVTGIRCPIPYLSWFIGQRQNRPVLNHTGLTGFWDFKLEFVPDGMNVRTGSDAPDGPNISTALREQLGLKLESEKAPVQVYIIDHAEKPTGN
jgi:uncharacterized protein (TIGR03435 family)